MKGIKKYYIGIGVLSFLTLILFVYVVITASGQKRDKQVNETASEIATDLNNYISQENKIPDDLGTATPKDIPEEITYTNNNDGTYTLCVSYNNKSGLNLDASSVLFQGLSGSYSSSSYDYQSSYKARTLYISNYGWKKGKNCVDIEPRLYKNNNLFDSSSLDKYCDPSSNYYDFYKDSCVDGKYQYY